MFKPKFSAFYIFCTSSYCILIHFYPGAAPCSASVRLYFDTKTRKKQAFFQKNDHFFTWHQIITLFSNQIHLQLIDSLACSRSKQLRINTTTRREANPGKDPVKTLSLSDTLPQNNIKPSIGRKADRGRFSFRCQFSGQWPACTSRVRGIVISVSPAVTFAKCSFAQFLVRKIWKLFCKQHSGCYIDTGINFGSSWVAFHGKYRWTIESFASAVRLVAGRFGLWTRSQFPPVNRWENGKIKLSRLALRGIGALVVHAAGDHLIVDGENSWRRKIRFLPTEKFCFIKRLTARRN